MIFRLVTFLLILATVNGAVNMKKRASPARMAKNKKNFDAKFKVTSGIKPLAGSITSGWAYSMQYENADCTGTLFEESGYVLGKCITLDVGTVKYTASVSGNSATLYRDYYTTTDCSGTSTTSSYTGSTVCNTGFGFKLATSSDKNYPDSLNDGFLYKESTDDTCDTDYYFDFSFFGGICFVNDDDDVSYDDEYYDDIIGGAGSYTISCDSSSKATAKGYATTDCSGSSQSVTQTYPTTCQVDDDEVADVDDGLANDDDINIYLGYYTLSCESGDSSDSACFSAYETVTNVNGEQVAISEVKVGDKILTVSESGERKFADVVFVPHAADNQISATFHEVETVTGRTLKATRDHLVEAGECGSAHGLVSIEAVSSGMCLMTVDGEESVVSNVMTRGQGVHTVVTSEASGKIVVNGVIASSFGTNHVMVNTYYNIHRAVYAIFPSMLKSMTSVLVNGMFGEVMAKAFASL